MNILNIIRRFYKYLIKTFSAIIYRIKLAHFGKKSFINKSLRIDGSKNIWIGSSVIIEKNSWLASMPLTNTLTPVLKIGNGCRIGHFNEIYATNSIIIEDNVLTADRVYISDNFHSYDDIDTPILKQHIKQNGEGVTIGEGSWLGVGVCVLGANVGKHCVIGSNAVVTKDIPDYSVAVGIPARVIKRYDFETKEWRKTNPDSSFIK